MHCWILEAKMDMALGLHFICPDGRGGHPLTVHQNTFDHLCSIIIRWSHSNTGHSTTDREEECINVLKLACKGAKMGVIRKNKTINRKEEYAKFTKNR